MILTLIRWLIYLCPNTDDLVHNSWAEAEYEKGLAWATRRLVAGFGPQSMLDEASLVDTITNKFWPYKLHLLGRNASLRIGKVEPHVTDHI